MNSPYKGKFRVSQQFKGAAHDGLDLVGVDSKSVYSTIDGTVERAGWENAAKRTQGFGQYVRICKAGTADRYYFGHLSKINVKVGDTVKAGQLIGTEGSTGKSTGSHCHYCVRTDCSKQKFRDISAISGIPNAVGTYIAPEDDIPAAVKSAEEAAREVIAGKWGNGDARKQALINAGYDYSAVQSAVNALCGKAAAPVRKSDEETAREVMAGKWGNGAERKAKLKAAGYDFSVIQALVNKMC